MPVIPSIRRPLYLAAGTTDLIVEKLRELPSEYHRLQGQVTRLDASTLRLAVEDYSTKAVEAYGDLLSRGEKLVGSIRRQKASQVLDDELSFTQWRAKSTATTARKAAGQTRTRAKATASSARKTATAASKATRDAASKVG